ncbi:MAG TPA: hypothetical protein VHK26_01575 [Methyloceanibacter sp.]|nr:hypothetical protein [Methyloceanibacter sp.]
MDITAAQAMAASREEAAPALEEAKQLLASIIGCDGKLVKEIQEEAKGAGISWRTMQRAKDALKLTSERDGGPWIWKR